MANILIVLVLVIIVWAVLDSWRRNDVPVIVVTQMPSAPGGSVFEVLFWFFVAYLVYLILTGGLPA